MIIDSVYQTIIDHHCIITRPSNSRDISAAGSGIGPLPASIQYYRVIGSSQHLSSRQLQRCWNDNIDCQLKFISTEKVNGVEKIIGVSSISHNQEKNYCDLSVKTSMQRQYQGLIKALFRKLIEFAESWGVNWFYCKDHELATELTIELARTSDLELGPSKKDAQQGHYYLLPQGRIITNKKPSYLVHIHKQENTKQPLRV